MPRLDRYDVYNEEGEIAVKACCASLDDLEIIILMTLGEGEFQIAKLC